MEIIYILIAALVVVLPVIAWKFSSFYQVASTVLVAILFVIFVLLIVFDLSTLSFLKTDGFEQSFGEKINSRQMPFMYYIIIFAFTLYVLTLKNIHIIAEHFGKNRVSKGF